MTTDEIIDLYKQLYSMSRSERTKTYNSLEVQERREFAEYLRNLPDNKATFNKFKNDIAKQAIDDFWFNEREAIISGTSTYNWTPEQIEDIMNIDPKTGKMNSKAGKARMYDSEWNLVLNNKGKPITYNGHHMLNVKEYPEYAGDWRNMVVHISRLLMLNLFKKENDICIFQKYQTTA